MYTATCHLESVSPMSQSRYYEPGVPKLEKENADDYEKRTWRNRLHVTEDGRVFIPPMQFKYALDTAAQMLSIQIKGKGKATYTKHFKAGVMCFDPVVLPIKAEDVPGEWLFMNADGRKGSGKRVMRCYPAIAQWSAVVVFHVFDVTVTKEVFEQHLVESGRFAGIGRFRPSCGGFYGRYKLSKSIEFSNPT